MNLAQHKCGIFLLFEISNSPLTAYCDNPIDAATPSVLLPWLQTDEIEKPVQYDVVKSEHLLEPTLYSCLEHFTFKVPLSTEEFTM